ncbi:LLM class flavin-dependent oxidoreductase [Nocardia brasiliensis]|uniref:LLM class flavin-dependent oxidoreductase n=1 Tax=Nocardia brasiliensis TaxID=37326 RepID=UPI00366BDD2B
MRIDYAPWGETLSELTAAATAAEAAGAGVLWLPELHRSATVVAAAVAPTVRTAGVGTAVALAFARSPMVTALAALDLDELAGGRFVLGLGTGARRLIEEWHGAEWERPVARLRDTVTAIRAFVAGAHLGAPIAHEGAVRRMRVSGYQRPYPPVRREIPIYLAAVGPQLVRLAGEIADGWLSHELCSPTYLTEVVLPRLDAGLAKAGRDRSRLEVVASLCCSITDDAIVARRRAAGTVGFYASVAGYREFFEAHGLGAEQDRVIAARKAGGGANRLADSVPDAMIEPLVAAGTPEQVAARIGEYEGTADVVKLSPAVYGLPPQDIRACQARLIDLIRELSR